MARLSPIVNKIWRLRGENYETFKTNFNLFLTQTLPLNTVIQTNNKSRECNLKENFTKGFDL